MCALSAHQHAKDGLAHTSVHNCAIGLLHACTLMILIDSRYQDPHTREGAHDDSSNGTRGQAPPTSLAGLRS